MVYCVIFEHIKAGMVRVEREYIQLTDKIKITSHEDIERFQHIINEKKIYIDPVVFDWKELGLQETIEIKK